MFFDKEKMTEQRSTIFALLAMVVMMNVYLVAGSGSGVVLELTSQNFESTIQANPSKVFFVKFFAPWCGHCKRLAPTWSELAKDLDESSLPHFQNVQLANVNCDETSDICRKYSIRGYPTLKLFVGGKPLTEYYGYRTIPRISSRMFSPRQQVLENSMK